MIPPVMAHQLEQGFVDYLKATFPFANEPFRSSFEDFAHDGASLMREPYLSVRLPFRSAAGMPTCFEAVRPPFVPYVHQQRAYDRLACEHPRSTLIATGTGSGKTECFLYPILEHCWRHKGERGVKALIIYPMNALATDQSGRIAKLIWNNPKLRGNVTVGLYVGGLKPGEGSCCMTEEGVITDRETMRSNPPDILLTNYKMLDYLLVRPADAEIWRENAPETLSFVAVDEMHTFDGAQGTDLACLLRRLKGRLRTPQGYLCCVGTSATMGGEGADETMRAFAHDVFDEDFDDGSVICEDRLSTEEFFSGVEPGDETLPDEQSLREMAQAVAHNDRREYLACAAAAFFPEFAGRDVDDPQFRLDLGVALMGSAFLRNVLLVARGHWFQTSQVPEDDLWRYRLDYPDAGLARQAVDAVVALVAHARTGAPGHLRPFLNVSAQLWTRELARFLATLDPESVSFDLGSNLDAARRGTYFPLVSCRDCGQVAWAGVLGEHGGRLDATNLDDFYNSFFGDAYNLVAVYPDPSGDLVCQGEDVHSYWLCPECRKLQLRDPAQGPSHTCVECSAPCIGVKLVVMASNMVKGRDYRQYICPCCASRTGISLVGLRSTTTSEVALTQVFGSDFDDDNHALAFSDNVQDASYRATFFTGRTWRFALRGAMRRYLCDGGEGSSLEDYKAGLIRYWKNVLTLDAYVARFIAPNTTWRRAYEAMLKDGHLGSGEEARRLVADVDERLGYEVLFEFGMRSNVGRTLERSAAAVLAYDPDMLAKATREACMLVRDTTGRDVDEGAMGRIVAGVLEVMRGCGAVADPCYEGFVKHGADRYVLAGKGKNYPNQHQTIPVFPRLSGSGKGGFSWPGDLAFMRVVRGELGPQAAMFMAADITAAALRAAYHVGLLAKLDEGGENECLGIDERHVFVTGRAQRFVCDCCGNAVVHAEVNANVWEGACCPAGPCPGHLHSAASARQGLDYFGRIFDRSDGRRIRAREHTGLLARPVREEVERMFKAPADKAFEWYPNVLSCTPTLEMGIDIGDLSSLVLCSMPPGQAQFLQRVGRAGRRDGNSFTTVIADASPHGAYFYAEPHEMIEGQVDAPRVFLHAAAVLERQFMAFCMDRWVRDAGHGAVVPHTMGECLPNMRPDRHDLGKFPFNYLMYVKTRMQELFGDFLDMFKGHLANDEEAVQELRAFVMEGVPGDPFAPSPMHVRVLQAFTERNDELNGAREQVKNLNKLIRVLREKPKDSAYASELKKAEVERNAAADVVKSMLREEVYGFLSREGLLPNYAFPEDGVDLRVVMRRQDEKISEPGQKRGRYTRTVQEYSRAAAVAMGDFAPGNTFYADGRHFQVDQVDMATAEFETWRLCPNCSHAEKMMPTTPVKACPKCGDVGWEDQGQLRTMLRLRGVVSNCDYTESMKSDDSSDRRVSERYARQLLVDVDPLDVVRAYRVSREGYDFAYEFTRRATMREINFGVAADALGQKSRIAGDERVRTGFRVCKKCGRLEIGGHIDHAYACPVRVDASLEPDAVEDCLFLYRQFETEALRLTIPEVTLPGSESEMAQTFTAAVMLGLRKKFGNVDHLSTTVSEEPIANSEFRMRYLVVYDSVPGGTGYLKQLVADDHALHDVLELARAALEECSCNLDPQKDGCYHCLYAYRQSRELGNISRRRALLMLKDFLDAQNKIEVVGSIAAVNPNVLIQSELEKRFVDALRMLRLPDGSKPAVTSEIVHGKEGWRLQAAGMEWEVEPQVYLSAEQGVALDCCPDFVLYPSKSTREAGHLPVAVFTDGYAFHEGIAADDTAKREAVRRSGKYRVWSLSYDDVVSYLDMGYGGDYHLGVLNPSALPVPAFYSNFADATSPLSGIADLRPLDVLGCYLALPTGEDAFFREARAFAVGMSDPYTQDRDGVLARVQVALDAVEGPGAESGEYDGAFAVDWHPGGSRQLGIYGFNEVSGSAPKPTIVSNLDDSGNHTDAYKKAWNSFWHLWNLMQFEPGFVAVSSSGIETGSYAAFWRHAEGDAPLAESAELIASENAWTDMLTEEFREENALSVATVSFMRELASRGVSAEGLEVGLDVGDGIPAELVWEDKHVCFLAAAEADCREELEAAGWNVMVEGEDNEAVIASLMEG